MKEYRFESSSKHLYRWTETRYDERGNLISEAEVSCDGTAPTEAELTEKRITYTYDDEDRLSKVSYPEGFDGNVSALEYAYDNYGRLSEITVVTATGSAVLREYTYNVWGQIESIKDNRQALGGTGYTLKTYGYDKLDRNTAIVITDSEREGVAEQYTYGYNYEDQITEETRKNFYPADEENQVNETRHYGYDNLGRMTFGDGKQYTYDSVGNCLTVKNSQTGETETVNTYNSLNQLVASGDSTYTYDANGNQIRETKGSTVKDFTYDADNRLRMITCMENGAYIFRQDNGYNGLGQRTSKFVEAVGVSLYTAYDYQMGSVVHTSGYPSRNALNLLGDAGNIIASERPASDESGESGKEYYFYNKDIRSSTTSVLDSSGSCEVSYEYGDFGETTIHGKLYNEICYTGGIYDETIGLYYLNARYYSPSDKRFLTEDTYRGSESNPNTLHLYAYCANNPVNYVDPSGHFWETVLDIASIGWSAHDLMNDPSWINLGYLIWDIGATFLPFVPGSYTAKGLKGASKIKKLGVKVPSTLYEVQKGKHLTVGTYKSLSKLYKGAKNRKNIEIHHIIEKRFAKAFNLSADAFPAVALDKKVHKEITRRFREVAVYNHMRKPRYYKKFNSKELETIVCKVYKDMPQLKEIALKQIRQYAKK